MSVRGAGIAALASALLVVAGCGGDADNADDSAGAGSRPATVEKPTSPRVLQRQSSQSFEAAKAEAEQERREDEASEGEFGEDQAFEFLQEPFTRALNALPVRNPPLPIQQYVYEEGSDEVIARVNPEDFLCGWAPPARKAAVETFYREAIKTFRAEGVTRFSLVIAPMDDQLETFPALAKAARGRVRLTDRGAADSDC